MIAILWNENTNERVRINENISLLSKMRLSFELIKEDKSLICIAFIEGLFKVSLQLFLLIWTPLLEETIGGKVHPGAIFTCFMLARLIGSEFFKSIKVLFKINSYILSLIICITGCLSFFF